MTTDHEKVARLEALAAISGVMIALQSRANGELSHMLGNSIEAALVSFSSGLTILLIIFICSAKVQRGIQNLWEVFKTGDIKIWEIFGGVLGGLNISFQTWAVPLNGVAIFSVASIAGQTVMSLFVDRIGLSKHGQKKISTRRISAAVITVLAVFVSVLNKFEAHTFSLLAVILSILGGAFVGVQRALNARVNYYLKASFGTSLLNMFTGTLVLAIILLLKLIFLGDHINGLPTSNYLIYTGGAIGVLYIAFTTTIVQRLGVLTSTLFSVGGTLIGSLLIDFLIPSKGIGISWYLVVGILLSYFGVIVGGESKLFNLRNWRNS